MFDSTYTDCIDQAYPNIPTTAQVEELSTGNRVDLIDGTVFFIKLDIDDASTALVLRMKDQLQLEGASLTVVERVKRLDSGLDIPRKSLSDILRISRTTLYDLLNGKLREYRNEQRLQQIERAFAAIRSNTAYPIGRSVNLIKLSGATLFDILNADNIDISKVVELTKAIDIRKAHSRESSLALNASENTTYLTPIAD